jgi:hypothetical protein
LNDVVAQRHAALQYMNVGSAWLKVKAMKKGNTRNAWGMAKAVARATRPSSPRAVNEA